MESRKNGTDEPNCRTGKEMQTWRRDLWSHGGKERVGQIERVALKHIHYHMQSRLPVGSCYITQGAQPGAL